MQGRKIAESAKKLAEDKLLMNSYRDFYNGKGYFLTKNTSLKGAGKKPIHFPISERGFLEWWNKLELSQKKYLLLLSGINEYRVTGKSISGMRKAYDAWNGFYLPVFYDLGRGWACNLFVGEVLLDVGIKTAKEGKYYSAQQIWNASPPFKLVDKKNVEVGDIVAFRGTHVEIVTKVSRNQWLYDDDFCSRGVGRGASDFGTEKCDGIWIGGTREINNEKVRFLRVNKS